MTKVLAGRASDARADESYWRYLLRACREHTWRRRQTLRSFKTGADWESHCRTVRQRFRAALGPLPEPTRLNPRLTGVLQRDGYTVEKLMIETQPDFFVTANLYLPTRGRFPVPAILNPVGHWPNSKAQDVVQARGIGLARKGFVALIYDPIGQGERSQYWDATTHSNPLVASTAQHSAVCNPCFLIGQTVINYMVWDGVRLLDYLETRPEVDASRIGCTGASGGGTYTMFLAAFDQRIKASVPVCSTSTYERLLAEGNIGEPCQDPVASYRDDLDMADLLMCAAPTAVQIIAASYDFFPLIGAREVFLDVEGCYTALGIPERASLVEVPAHHDYNKPMREAMYGWFNRWLGNDGANAIEPPHEPEPPEELWCTTTGQVITAIGGQTVISLNRARAQSVIAAPPKIVTTTDAIAQRDRVQRVVPKVLNYVGGQSYSGATTLDRSTVNDLTVEQFVFDSEPDLPIPGLAFIPPGRGPHRALLFLHDRGKSIEADIDGLIPALTRTGLLIMAIDLRGFGETAWQRRLPHDPVDFGLLGDESMLAYVGYLLGVWPLTQRVADAVRALDVLAVRTDVDTTELGIIGRGSGGLIALHAAALDSRIKRVATYDMLATYRSIIEAERYTCPVSALIPDVLLHYDLPDLVGALTPTRILVANPVDAVGDPLPTGVATVTYAGSQQMYGLLGGANHLHVRSRLERPELIEHLVGWAASSG